MSVPIKALSKQIPSYFDLVKDIDNSFGINKIKKTSVEDIFNKINEHNKKEAINELI